jgi:hypothetical protein
MRLAPTAASFREFEPSPLEEHFENEPDIGSAQGETVGEAAMGAIHSPEQV